MYLFDLTLHIDFNSQDAVLCTDKFFTMDYDNYT